MNTAANLDCADFHYPDQRAIADVDRSVSFSEFRRDTNRMASVLMNFDIQPGDHVA